MLGGSVDEVFAERFAGGSVLSKFDKMVELPDSNVDESASVVIC